MSVGGLCGVFIPGWVGVGKWLRQLEVVCPKRRHLELRRRGITQKGTNYINYSTLCLFICWITETKTLVSCLSWVSFYLH